MAEFRLGTFRPPPAAPDEVYDFTCHSQGVEQPNKLNGPRLVNFITVNISKNPSIIYIMVLVFCCITAEPNPEDGSVHKQAFDLGFTSQRLWDLNCIVLFQIKFRQLLSWFS